MTAETINANAAPAAPAAAASNARHEEYQYLDLIREIMDEGEHRPDRYESSSSSSLVSILITN
jgi:thymidylate synthase